MHAHDSLTKDAATCPMATLAVEIVTCNAAGAPQTARRVKVADLLGHLPKSPATAPHRGQPRLG